MQSTSLGNFQMLLTRIIPQQRHLYQCCIHNHPFSLPNFFLSSLNNVVYSNGSSQQYQRPFVWQLSSRSLGWRSGHHHWLRVIFPILLLFNRIHTFVKCSQGIGKCTAELFAREGALVTVTDLDAGKHVCVCVCVSICRLTFH